jgi:hypothetical protein
MGGVRAFGGLLATSIAALLLRTRRIDARTAGLGHVFTSVLMLLAATLVFGLAATSPPRQFWVDDFSPFALEVLCLLAVATLVAHGIRRPGLSHALASILLLQTTVVTLGAAAVAGYAVDAFEGWPVGEQPWPWLWIAAIALWAVLAVAVALRALHPAGAIGARAVAAVGITAVLTLPWFWLQSAWFFYPADPSEVSALDAEHAETSAYDEPLTNPPLDAVIAEATLSAQDARLDAALAALAPQRPGVVDLYVLAAGLDGGEDVFLNEAAYVQRLFDGRYGTAGRSLVLANNPASIDALPLATRTNLRRALAGIAARMDAAEDVLFVWIASHGGEEHELLVRLDPLALAQIDPPSLAAMLADTGLAHRVVGISACYSGGYVPALADPRNLVLTAASADQPSFGCGPDADITWFGRALLAEAFNKDADPVTAFATAAATVAEREAEHEYDPSDPQLARASAVEAAWARWRAQVSSGPEVPFAPWSDVTSASSAR